MEITKNVFVVLFIFSTILFWMGCEKDPTTIQDNGACSTITDSRDGETYSVVKIGNQCWMAENLRYNASGSWLNPSNPSITYGRLYDWATVMNGSGASSSSPSGVEGICPSGWHLPSDAEWTTLTTAIGGTETGTAMKSTTGWSTGASTNTSGFNAFPAGPYDSGSFGNWGDYTSFWSSTEDSSTVAWYRSLDYGGTGVYRSSSNKANGFSCRCIKD
jgi:uncharacterized protein (TIGR02145 family)